MDSPTSVTEHEPFRAEIDAVTKREAFLVREILRWLTFAVRPLTLTELRSVIQFVIKTEGLRITCPEDLGAYLYENLSATVEIRDVPVAVAYALPDGKYAWKTQHKSTAAIRTKAIKRAIRLLPCSHALYFDAKYGHIRLAQVCLRYLSTIENVDNMSENHKIEVCAEHHFAKYSLDSFAIHTASASRPCLKKFLQSDIFNASCVRGITQGLLPYAAKNDDLEMFDILIASLDPNAREGAATSHTALSHASSRGNMAIVDVLLSHPNIQVDLKTHADMTPLHLAILNEHFEIARLLLSKGADASLRESHGWNAMRLLFRSMGIKNIIWNHQSEVIRTLDHIVAQTEGRFEIDERDVQGAVQNGNIAALHHLMAQHKPLIIPTSPLDDSKRYSKLEPDAPPSFITVEPSIRDASKLCRCQIM